MNPDLPEESRAELQFETAMIGVDSCEAFEKILATLQKDKHILLASRSETVRMANVWALAKLDADYTQVWAISQRVAEKLGVGADIDFPAEFSPDQNAPYEDLIEGALAHMADRQRAYAQLRAQILKRVSRSVPGPTAAELESLAQGVVPGSK